MKRLSITLDDTTFDLIRQEAERRNKRVQTIIIDYLMIIFPSDVLLCDKCGKFFSVEADEGSLREEGAFCTKHLPREGE